MLAGGGGPKVNNTRLYRALGLEPGADRADVKRAHREMSDRCRPGPPTSISLSVVCVCVRGWGSVRRGSKVPWPPGRATTAAAAAAPAAG